MTQTAKFEQAVEAMRVHYREFAPNKFEGRYWDNDCAVVASIGLENAWAAYIGVGPGERKKEDLIRAADCGAKLSEADARHFFPEMARVPYRP